MKLIERDEGELQNKYKISNIRFFLHNDTDWTPKIYSTLHIISGKCIPP